MRQCKHRYDKPGAEVQPPDDCILGHQHRCWINQIQKMKKKYGTKGMANMENKKLDKERPRKQATEHKYWRCRHKRNKSEPDRTPTTGIQPGDLRP